MTKQDMIPKGSRWSKVIIHYDCFCSTTDKIIAAFQCSLHMLYTGFIFDLYADHRLRKKIEFLTLICEYMYFLLSG